MKKKATMNDIATIVGISQSAVSMILNQKNTSSFPKETIEKVYEVAKQLNYKFRTSPKEPLKTSNKNIMVIAVKMTNPYYAMMLQSIEIEANLRGYTVLTCNTYHKKELEARYLTNAIQEDFSGVIFLYPPNNLEAFTTASEKVPIIAICDNSSEIKNDIIELNNFKAGCLAAEHLVQLGHRNIALLTLPPAGNIGRIARIEGVSSVLKDYNCLDKLIIHQHTPSHSSELLRFESVDFDYRVGYTLAQLESLYTSNITAFICMNDMVAYGLMDALLERKYTVPDDFSIISFDNLLYSNFNSIQLTTVDHHMEVLGQYAIGMLLQKINTMIYNTKNTSDIVARFKVESPPNLVIRKSTKAIKIVE